MPTLVDLIGKTFGSWTVIKRDDTFRTSEGYKITKWTCRCECGFVKSVYANHLVGNYSKKCRKCADKTKKCKSGARHKLWKGYGKISSTYYNRLKSHAVRRKIKFNISIKYMWNLFIKQNNRCAYSGVELIWPNSNKEDCKGFRTASLDRINSKKGYVHGNVQWVHKDINVMKWTLDENDFLNQIQAIYDHKVLHANDYY